MSETGAPKHEKPRWTFISLALFVLGLLILVPSGLCTAIGSFLSLAEGDPSFILLVLMFGALPIAGGAVLVWAGLKARPRE
jgi:hypothetical protein